MFIQCRMKVKETAGLHLQLKCGMELFSNVNYLWIRTRKDSLFVSVLSFSVMSDSATPWTVAHQVPPSMWFSSKNTGVGCHFLLQGIFPTQGSNPGLLHCRQTLYRLSHLRSPIFHCIGTLIISYYWTLRLFPLLFNVNHKQNIYTF